MKKTASMLLTAALLIAALITPAFAVDPFDPDQDLSLDVTFEVDGATVSGVHFYLYRVADMAGVGALTYTETFAPCHAGPLLSLSVEETQKLCEDLYDYLEKQEAILPQYSGVTDKYGAIHFPAEDKKLLPGLYLLTSERFYDNGISHEAQPFLTCLPYRGADEVWDYDMSVMPKVTDNRIDVQTVWEDAGYEENRPESVKVELLQGTEQKVYDTVTLSPDNGWYHLWEDLPGGYQWSVREKPEPENYKVYVDRIPGGYRIINTYSPPPGEILPQTGLLWWPVPVMASLGMLLFLIGWVKNRKRNR